MIHIFTKLSLNCILCYKFNEPYIRLNFKVCHCLMGKLKYWFYVATELVPSHLSFSKEDQGFRVTVSCLSWARDHVRTGAGSGPQTQHSSDPLRLSVSKTGPNWPHTFMTLYNDFLKVIFIALQAVTESNIQETFIVYGPLHTSKQLNLLKPWYNILLFTLCN